MGIDKSCSHVTIASTPWLFILQVALLVIHFGHIATLPWWLLWLPVLIWVLELFLVAVIIVAFLAYATGESLSNNGVVRVICATVGLVILIYLLMYVWGWVTGFLITLV
jgi:hypothetical protein